jgi:hydroxyacylglutathione hydrolase
MTTSIYIKQISVGPMQNFAYLVGADDGKSCAMIDPSWDAAKLVGEAERDGRRIEAILLTHAHFDHVNALEDVAKKLKIPVYVHVAEAHALPKGLDVQTTKEGTMIETAGLEIKCLHTPGHSPGSQCFMVDGAVFTGDTLFVEGCGRVDLEGGSPDDMVISLSRLGELPGETVVYPGHDYGSKKTSTIEKQRASNPYMNEMAETII